MKIFYSIVALIVVFAIGGYYFMQPKNSNMDLKSDTPDLQNVVSSFKVNSNVNMTCSNDTSLQLSFGSDMNSVSVNYVTKSGVFKNTLPLQESGDEAYLYAGFDAELAIRDNVAVMVYGDEVNNCEVKY